MPASWRMNHPPRPQVTATVGGKRPSQLFEELQRLLRRKAQRVENFPRIDHGLQPGTMLGGTLDRHWQHIWVPCSGGPAHGKARNALMAPMGGLGCRRNEEARFALCSCFVLENQQAFGRASRSVEDVRERPRNRPGAAHRRAKQCA
jgi:hypothetical protein